MTDPDDWKAPYDEVDGYHLLVIRRFRDKSAPAKSWDKVRHLDVLKERLMDEIRQCNGYESGEIWLSKGRIMQGEDDVLIWKFKVIK